MTKFVGCIDLHNGEVKQIVGGTLRDEETSNLKTNFVSKRPSSFYARLYHEKHIDGCHVIKLGPNNDEAAIDALKAAPGFLQVGGGINLDNCEEWLAYASKIIVTSWLFTTEGDFQMNRLKQISKQCGPERLVVDLSCRKVVATGTVKWVVAMNKWQKLTSLELSAQTFQSLSMFSHEFLIHAADVEGLCRGIEEDLVERLYEWTKDLPNVKIVYAGGAKSIEDLELVSGLSHGKVDLTFGSSLDLFGGELVKFEDCCKWNETH
ncbi:LAMI_0C04742g1_1 [Lachancea mirantina]|uniref:1-(5-phosphoribosyl)-5-[(5-phosphoribosylamino)methylideneamino] imidazole-4-carboxamide isomerase n=1 Tax=Lachancea mirantina TaxID=1230905 RepID=A0A1G4J2W3_9SACH|nr:LAMI_0C04742g1_1 [Lachancea mirantina]